MAESTISIKPFGKQFTEANIRDAFKEFALKRIHINQSAAEAFVEFASANDVEALNIAYEDCKVPTLNNAEIGLVEAGFEWPKAAPVHEEQGLIEIVEVNKDCLISIKECENISQITEEKIQELFKTFAISKIVRFVDRKEIVIEFQAAGDLETLEIEFQDYKVPALGDKAFIDTTSVVDSERFIKQYRAAKKTSAAEKKEEEREEEIENIREEAEKRERVEEIENMRDRAEKEELEKKKEEEL